MLAPNDMKYSVCVHTRVRWPLNWTAVVIPVHKHRMGINLLIKASGNEQQTMEKHVETVKLLNC